MTSDINEVAAKQFATKVAQDETLRELDRESLELTLTWRFNEFLSGEEDEVSTVQLAYLVDPASTLDELQHAGIHDYTYYKMDQWFKEYDEEGDFDEFLDQFIDLSSDISPYIRDSRYVEDLNGVDVEVFRKIILAKVPILAAALEEKELEANTAPAKASCVENDWTPADNWASSDLQDQINKAQQEGVVPTRSRTMRL